jgi:UDP-N-acetylmuramyl-tripeptide synthetase
MLELHTPVQAAHWLQGRVTGTLQTDSRQVRQGDGFIAWPGAATDGRQYVATAIRQGASACLVERVDVERFEFSGDSIASCTDLKAASGPIAAAYFDQPSHQLDVIAVTGTNGKTSTAWWLAHSLSNLELAKPIPCGLVGTLGIGSPRRQAPHGPVAIQPVANGLTTPDPILLQRNLRDFVAAGVQACALEASSIGIEEHRLDGTRIHTAVFTNFTQDHLDYHGSMNAYWQAKASLFGWPGLRSAVINVDDATGHELAVSVGADAIATGLDVWTVSCEGPARLRAENIRYDTSGLIFEVVETLGGTVDRHEMATRMIGQYNVSNLLGVIAAMRSMGVPLAACIASSQKLAAVPGRMECMGGQAAPMVVVDYAHTPDALDKTLQALRPLTQQRGGHLWCIFGCGGDRDSSKRPLMGAMAAQNADHIVVTSDNPRNEKPQAIANQILPGLAGHNAVLVQLDRAQAISDVILNAAAEDVVLIAGKGHETYQEIAGVRLAFSDQAVTAQGLRDRSARLSARGAGV